ncbi:MAG: universal stress protein [SAR202 cluster bacterium]|nr:universal stress protein [SAR202 cluster bacterium]|tara:strand:- start:1086 stop:1490 length:405 start_codon:yes stop_codon:yes gene_type:complete
MLLAVINGTDIDNLVIETTCKIARHDKEKITVIYVIVIPRNKPIDQEMSFYTEKGEKSLQKAEELSQQFKVKIDGQILQARSRGPSIVNYAKEEGFDMLIMGINKNKPEGTLPLDADTKYVLANSAAKVITCRL